MKKLIILLGSLAIANFSFILPVKAQLADDYQMSIANDYLRTTQKHNIDIYTEYEASKVADFLALQSCQTKSLSESLKILRVQFYPIYAATILLFNDDYEFKELIRLKAVLSCPSISIDFTL